MRRQPGPLCGPSFLRPALLGGLLCLPLWALAASRPPVGGTLRAVHLPVPREAAPHLQDTPLEATLASLSSRPLCRLGLEGQVQPMLARAFERTGPTTLRVQLAPGLRTAAGAPLTAAQVARSLEEVRTGPTPYRALLSALREPPRALSTRVLELRLLHAAPDLERTLCHPALAVASGARSVGPFAARAGGEALVAVAGFPRGRPYLERVVPVAADERGVLRRFSLRQAQLALGVGGEGALQAQAALSLTAVSVPPALSALKPALERAAERAELTRYFVRGPAQPAPELLPPALLPHPAARPTPQAAPPGGGREVVLHFDAALEDQRAVAERLQVKLRDGGWRILLRPLPREELRRRWSEGTSALVLHSLLLPPLPGPALALVLEAAGAPALRREEEAALAQVAEEKARAQRARERAVALREKVGLVPLYAQALAIRTSPSLQGLAFDAQGLLVLDDAWLSGE